MADNLNTSFNVELDRLVERRGSYKSFLQGAQNNTPQQIEDRQEESSKKRSIIDDYADLSTEMPS